MSELQPPRRYVEPGWFTRNVLNRAVALLTRAGISVWGSRELRVRGRKSGDAAKLEVLRAYLKRWKAEVGVFFGGIDANASDADLLRIAPDHPAFRLAFTQNP
jgi:hypothetical protein